ncbi:hypothetical protein [Spiroplasma endosymbiont of Amphibalanus improvisus]|uniref:hypothetical protein n=1 Tax=Spiroplasma endosymbiont of Amphibalanus improvisus TaxID=3066327 RepID=UPI00313E9496
MDKNKIETTLKIFQTEDYNLFASMLNQRISKWFFNKDNPDNDNVIQNFLFSQSYKNSFYLWGPSGSGKTEYINNWITNDKPNYIQEIKKITKLSEIDDEKIFYIFDAINESNDFDESKLQEILKDKNIFIIFSGWNSLKMFEGYNINPSEEIVISKGWNKIKKYEWNNSFSIREKYLMCNLLDDKEYVKKIKDKEWHSIIWKAFERVFKEAFPDYKKEMEYFKNKIKINPFKIDEDNSLEFQNLKKKNIIQFNQEKKSYIYSHLNLTCHLFLRDYIDEIKNLNFNSLKPDTKKVFIELWKTQPHHFICWCKILKLESNTILNFVKKELIKIPVFSHKLLDDKLIDCTIKYSKLNFEDLKILSEKNKYNRIYCEYLLENINADIELNKNNLHADDIVYFVYSIMSPIRGDDFFPKVMNSMKISNFQNKIKWINKKNRQKMLNYILGRYIQGYIDSNFSALKISQLENILFSNWDINNKITFYDFVDKCVLNLILLFKDNYSFGFAECFDAVLNCGKGRNSILNASSNYSKFNAIFKCLRNNSNPLEYDIKNIFEIAHRYVNAWMYILFEKSHNPISIKEMCLYYRKQYFDGTFHKGTEITDPFEKFMMLLFKRYIYSTKNEPHYNKKFDYNLPVLSNKVQYLLALDDWKNLLLEIKNYLLKNPNLIELEWEIDKFIGKGGLNILWIRTYNIYEIEDDEAPKNAILRGMEIYDPTGIKYKIQNNQKVFLSNQNKFYKFIISYRLDGNTYGNKILDKTFEIELLNNNFKFKELPYIDITSWNISNHSKMQSKYDKYENEILPCIKNNYKINNLK